MNRFEFGMLVDGHTVRFERQFPGPAEVVWCFLTTRGLLGTWLGEGSIECKIGGIVRIHSPESSIRGFVTACKPYSYLALSWEVSPNDGASDKSLGWESHVTFELEARGDKTVLNLTHSPITSSHFTRTLALWHSHLDRLDASMRQQQPEAFLRRFNRVLPEYEHRMGAYGSPPRVLPRRAQLQASGPVFRHA